MIFRILVGLTGLLSCLAGAQHWLMLDAIGAQRGIIAASIAGAANLRADVGGIFLAIGLFALVAARTADRRWLAVTGTIVGCALAGRVASLALDGAAPDVWPPLLIETTVLALLGGAAWAWRRTPGKGPEGL